MVLNNLNVIHAIRTKGAINSAKRIAYMLNRYGLGSQKMKANILKYTAILKKYNIKGTFFITVESAILHKDFLANLKGIELAVHGYKHINYVTLHKDVKENHLQKINDIFKNPNFLTNGFRAPYLSQDNIMLDLLSNNGFLFDSSASKLWSVPSEIINKNKKAYDLALELYDPKDFELPYLTESGLLEIPVSLPDDEILIDRLGIKDSETIGKIWLDILDKTHKNKSLFVLQLHPERINIAANALCSILVAAKKKSPPIWITNLGELAKWWVSKPKNKRWPSNYQSALCITGDIDRMSLLK
jgi:peptidoglycan/xylan/chitin deacetylase (PgdA/CDA1 family)